MGYFLQTHFGVSTLSHPDNALEACALLTPLHIVPEWYFLCQYAMLKAVPNKNAGFIVLLTSVLILFFFGEIRNLTTFTRLMDCNNGFSVSFLGNAFISLGISSSFLIFFSLFSFILGWTFISLQIKEFRIMGLSINDSVYSSVFFFLTGLHFFHLVVGLFLLSLFFWGCSFPSKGCKYLSLRSSEVHLFYNLQNFYWHFLEILWLFIFLVLYSS